MEVFITLILVVASWAYAYVQTHQIISIKYVQFFAYQLYLHKAVKNKLLSSYTFIKLN